MTGNDSPTGRIGAVVAGVMYALTASPRRRLEGGRLTRVRLRKRPAAILAALLAAFSLTIAAAPSASATTSSGPYRIAQKYATQCVEDPGSNPSYTPVDTWSCNYDYQSNEQWLVVGPYTYSDAQGWHQGWQIMNVYSRLCLNPDGQSTSNGARIVQQTCFTDPPFLWTFNNDNTGYEWIFNLYSGLCLNASGGGGTNGTPVIQWNCHDSSGAIYSNNLWYRY